MIESFHEKIAIIPAKEKSVRCPGKNVRKINGKELFRYSVDFAISINYTPIVSTDSKKIIEWCKNNNILYFEEVVNESNMANCIEQVLLKYNCSLFLILQPTSPIRNFTYIHKMESLLTEDCKSVYTCDKIKFIGHYDGKFQLQLRDQNPDTKFFYFFDGNMILSRRSSFLKDKCIFDDTSNYIEESIPYSFQIDNEIDFTIVNWVLSNPSFSGLSVNTKSKKCAIVTNKCNHIKNYSDFIDSCDAVIRINKMDNLATRLVGSKTTDVLVASFWYYRKFSPEARKMQILRDESVQVWFIPEKNNTAEEYANEENIKNWKWMSEKAYIKEIDCTTAGLAVSLARDIYPDYDIYFIGDIDPKVRAPGSLKHPYEKEYNYIKHEISLGHLIPVLDIEKNNGDAFIFSKPVTLSNRWESIDQTLLCGVTDELDYVLTFSNSECDFTVKILGNRILELLTLKFGTILNNNNNILTVKWDSSSDEEEYKYNENTNKYESIKDPPNINQFF